MERKKFIRTCCYTAVGLPILASSLQSCGSIYYATAKQDLNDLIVAKSEFLRIKKNETVNREFVLLKTTSSKYPICVYKIEEENYIASLLQCTHRGCELNVGGGIYSCPCHGSEFSKAGKLLEGPAVTDLKTFNIETDSENVIIHLS
jgi:cytochrome b6-f complex iron-sulfur subunit